MTRLKDLTTAGFLALSDEIYERASQLLPGTDQRSEYLMGQWVYYLRMARNNSNALMIETLSLVCPEYTDPHYFVLPVDYIQNYKQHAYVQTLTLKHVASFWQLYAAMNTVESVPGASKTNDYDKSALLSLIFKDPSRAPMMSAIVADRGVILPETMLELLDHITPGTTALAEGVL